ncbi:MAG: HgcAB-associated protein [Candidatus Firestonebacteria bacterium]
MAKRNKKETCCDANGINNMSCCKVEALVSVDERGQMVLPKEVRDKANIKSGDKLAVASMGDNKKTCCICLIKVEELAGMVKNILGPVMEEINKGGKEK